MAADNGSQRYVRVLSPEPVDVILLGKRVFAGIVKDLEMEKLFWIVLWA